MKNSQFANLLKKYVDAHKLNNTVATKKFIIEFGNTTDYAVIPEPTDDIRKYATIFIKKGYKCSDHEFITKMVEYSDVVEEPKQTTARQRFSGEY